MKHLLTITALFFLIGSITAQQTAFIFRVSETSVSVVEGSIGITYSFALFPDTLNFEENNIDSLDVEFISNLNYNNIASVKIEQAVMSANSEPSFQRIATITVTDTNLATGNQRIAEVLQGATYVFRLAIETKQGQTINVSNKSITVDLGNPDMYCAKLNNTYRKSCHNCFQQDVIPLYAGGLKGALDYTRVIELDTHTFTLIL